MNTVKWIQDGCALYSLLISEPLVVISCTATWCELCKPMDALIDRLAQDYGHDARIVQLDLETHPSLARRFGVTQIPAVMFFQAGSLVKTLVGIQPYEALSRVVVELKMAV